MKAVRVFAVALAVVMLVTAVVPFAVSPVAASENINSVVSSPTDGLMAAAMGLPLLSPMSASFPQISLNLESNAASSAYGCTLVKQTPADWTKMRSRQYFDMKWTVKNTGSAVWNAKSTKYAYVGGTKMQTRGDSYTLNSTVGRGKQTALIVDMNAPRARGTYSTLWALYAGSTRFCRVTLSITVTR